MFFCCFCPCCPYCCCFSLYRGEGIKLLFFPSVIIHFGLFRRFFSSEFEIWKTDIKKNLVTRLATNFRKHIKTFIEALMIVIGEALHNFFSFSFQNQYIQISSQLIQSEETFRESGRGAS